MWVDQGQHQQKESWFLKVDWELNSWAGLEQPSVWRENHFQKKWTLRKQVSSRRIRKLNLLLNSRRPHSIWNGVSPGAFKKKYCRLATSLPRDSDEWSAPGYTRLHVVQVTVGQPASRPLGFNTSWNQTQLCPNPRSSMQSFVTVGT